MPMGGCRHNNNSICIAPLKIKFARGALQSKRTQRYKWAKPAKSDEVKIYIKAMCLLSQLCQISIDSDQVHVSGKLKHDIGSISSC
jgi:hypothetical protein